MALFTLPALIPAILSALVVGLVVRVLVAIGFSVVSYVGIGAGMDYIEGQIWSNLGQTSASILSILALARVDDGIQVILSAVAAVLLFKGMTGPFKRLLFIGN